MEAMKKLLLTLLVLGSSLEAINAQSWLWARQGYGNAEGYAVATNAQGDYFLTGYFYDTLSFGTYKLNSFYNTRYYYESFLVKYDKSGNVKWAIQSYTQSKSGNVYSYSVAEDKYGNSFVTGFFNDTIKFGNTILTAPHYQEMFIVKVDSNGNVKWAEQSGGYTFSYGDGTWVAADENGNVYATGYFDDTTKWGPYTLISTNHTSAFIVKYDTSGSVVWAKQADIRGGSCWAYCVAIDKFGNPFVTGGFDDTVSFGSNTLISKNGVTTEFLTKYGSNGNVIWAKQAKTFSVCCGGGNSIAFENTGKPYVTGLFTDTTLFDSDTLFSATRDIFLTKYDTDGTVIWAKAADVLDNGNWIGYSLATDSLNHIYLAAGRDYKLTNAEIQFGNVILSSNNVTDASIVMEFDSSGTALCGSILPSGGDDNNSIACDPTGKYIYYGGDFYPDTLVFGNDTLSYPYGEYPFVAGWKSCTEVTALNELESNTVSIEIYPNPFESICFIKLSENIQNFTPEFSFHSMEGREIIPDITYSSNAYILNKAQLSPGVYILSIKFNNQVLNKKIVLIN
jgi:hypothetical protein